MIKWIKTAAAAFLLYALFPGQVDGQPREALKPAHSLTMAQIFASGQGADIISPVFLQPDKKWIVEQSRNPKIVQGQRALLERNWSDAYSKFDAAVHDDPNNAVAIEYRGIARQMSILGERDPRRRYASNVERGHPRGAAKAVLEDYDLAIRMHPDCARLYRNRAIIRSWMNMDRNQILSDCRKAVACDSGDLACRLPACTMTSLFDSNEHALSMVNQALRQFPHSPSLHRERGKFYWRLGQFEKSVEDHKAALKSQPDDVDALRELAISWITMHQFDLAIEALSKAIRLEPTFADLYHTRGVAEIYSKRPQAAIDDATEALALGHSDPGECYFIRGNGEEMLRRWKDALEDFDRTLKIDPRKASALHERARTYAVLGMRRQALADVNAALAINPSMLGALSLRSQLSRQSGAYDQSILDLYAAEKAAAAGTEHLRENRTEHTFNRPIDSSTTYGQHVQYAKQFQRGIPPKAERLQHEVAQYSGIINADDSRPEAYFNRGIAYMGLAQYKSAMDDFNACSKRCSTDDELTSEWSSCLALVCARKADNQPTTTVATWPSNSADHDNGTPPQTMFSMKAVYEVLRQNLPAERLLQIADTGRKRATAHYFIGELALFSSDFNAAKQHLQWVEENADVDSDEYFLANAEVCRLSARAGNQPPP